MITLDLYELKNLMVDLSELGAANYAKIQAPGKDMISQREAFSLFQSCRVRRWEKKGLINRVRAGSAKNSKVLYSRAELMAVDRAERLNSAINQ